MILRRLGNKTKIAKKIQEYFPDHSIYIEPFFGAGGMYFNKPKAKYNILNDLDDDVYNLFIVLSKHRRKLANAFKTMPVHQKLWNHWKKNKETDPIKKALRFLFLSNYGFMGLPQTLRYMNGNTSIILYNNIDKTAKELFGCEFSNFDFRELFKKLPIKDDVKKIFIYCDPPYLDTNNNYSSGFNQQDVIDLFDVLEATGCKFAYSEFDHLFLIDQAKKRGLTVHKICERKNLLNRRVEILITNY